MPSPALRRGGTLRVMLRRGPPRLLEELAEYADVYRAAVL